MATILEFRTATRPTSIPQMRSRLAAAPAEIVFFPGVRYERWKAEPAMPAKPRRKAKKRDKIILKD